MIKYRLTQGTYITVIGRFDDYYNRHYDEGTEFIKVSGGKGHVILMADGKRHYASRDTLKKYFEIIIDLVKI